MTNKEYLQSLPPEELVKTHHFNCPYGTITIAAEEKKGNRICPKNDILKTLKGPMEIGEFIFSGKQKTVCDECKIKWLSKERAEQI